MPKNAALDALAASIRTGEAIVYLGADALSGVTHRETGQPIPADSDSLILAMNGGKPMAPKLMYEFPRAAMNQELKKGRSFVNRFLTATYDQQGWTESVLHRAIAEEYPSYLIDINRDTQMQSIYASRPHVLVVGIARIGGTDYRFKVYRWTGAAYTEIDQADVSDDDFVLFKPMGTPLPEPNYIASDADYVDYITELMGGFGVPGFLKRRRIGKKYVTLGLRLTRDTERMVFSDLIYGAASPAGWAVIESPTDKERRFCDTKEIEVVEATCDEVVECLKHASSAPRESVGLATT